MTSDRSSLGINRSCWITGTFASVIALVLAEIVVRLLIALNLPYFTQPGLYASYFFDDLYWRLYIQWEDKFKPASRERFHPVLGWSQAKVSETNPLGLREESLQELQSSGPKVLFFGDSFVSGQAPFDCFVPKVVEKKLRNEGFSTSVVHLGVGGYGVDQILLLYRAIASAQPVDRAWVIFGILPEDLNRSILTLRLGAKPRFSLASSGALSLSLPTYFGGRGELSAVYLEPTSLLWAILSNRLKLSEEGNKRKVERLNFRLLDELVSELKARQAGFSFINFADAIDVQEETWGENVLRDSLSALDTPVLRVDSMVRAALQRGEIKDPADLFAPGDGHMNCAGNSFVGNEIADSLLRNMSFRAFLDPQK